VETTKIILVVEDDLIQAKELTQRLGAEGYSTRHIATELEFMDTFVDFDPQLYAAAIVDMMLRWTDPSPHMKRPPAEILKEGFYNAGLRCCRKLKTAGIPSLIFTALDANRVESLQDEFKVVNKSRGYAALLQELKRLLLARSPSKRSL
jgi:CheY-like chemotaxis protein